MRYVSVDSDDFEDSVKPAKLAINDASLFYEPESSDALGFGFRCGFLGMLHMEIIQERLEREYNLDLITTAPTVVYEIVTNKGEHLHISNPSDLPDVGTIDEMREPICEANILVPKDYVVMSLRFALRSAGYKRICNLLVAKSLSYDLPMSEVVMDFFDRLKSVSRGFGISGLYF